LEELSVGLQILGDSSLLLESRSPSLAKQLMPKAFWQSYKIDLDGLRQLQLLPDTALVDEYRIQDLPSHLKNCFEHISGRYEGLTNDFYGFRRVLQEPPEQDPYILKTKEQIRVLAASYGQTRDLTEKSIIGLRKAASKYWFERVIPLD
jgi:hypothetical protein